MSGSFSHRILVLNRLWQAVNIVSVKRGFSLLFQEHASAILTVEGQFQVMDIQAWMEYSLAHPTCDGRDSIQTVRFPLRVPKVLLLRYYDRVPVKEVKFNREAVFQRDGYCCQYCGQKFPEHLLNLDHIIPRDMGGKTNWENIVTSCMTCNTRKANRMPHQANMTLAMRPVRPKRRPFVTVEAGELEDGWEYFLAKGE